MIDLLCLYNFFFPLHWKACRWHCNDKTWSCTHAATLLLGVSQHRVGLWSHLTHPDCLISQPQHLLLHLNYHSGYLLLCHIPDKLMWCAPFVDLAESARAIATSTLVALLPFRRLYFSANHSTHTNQLWVVTCYVSVIEYGWLHKDSAVSLVSYKNCIKGWLAL